MSIVTEFAGLAWTALQTAYEVEVSSMATAGSTPDQATDSAAKKAAAVTSMEAVLADPNQPVNWPKALAFLGKGFEDWALGKAIDVAVLLLNKTGFFAKS